MTRKRYIKLCMALGMSRNKANESTRAVRNISHAKDGFRRYVPGAYADYWKSMERRLLIELLTRKLKKRFWNPNVEVIIQKLPPSVFSVEAREPDYPLFTPADISLVQEVKGNG